MESANVLRSPPSWWRERSFVFNVSVSSTIGPPTFSKPRTDMSTSTDSNADIIPEFLAESRDNMDQMERDLVIWEKQPGDRETLDRIFRAIHTLKGTCGFLGFAKLEGIAH